jgi:hypothetical protein
MRFLKLLLLFIFACGNVAVHAQNKGAKKPPVAAPKYKRPPLKTMLGNYKDSAGIPSGEIEALIALPLRVVDDKKNNYTISSYQLLYRKKAVTEDEETGKVSPTFSILANRFQTTPLPESWINTVREDLKPGEELHFFDVIVMNPQGRLMFAPDLKITVL